MDELTTKIIDDASSEDFERELLANVRPQRWVNPTPKSRYDLLVIGAGPAGLVAANGAAAFGARVALIERDLLGGDCLNFGCVPSKAIIRSAHLLAEMRDAQRYGVPTPDTVATDFSATMQRMRRLRARISRDDSIRHLSHNGVDVFFGEARFSGRATVDVGDVTLHFRKAMIATGARPDTPDIPGLAEAGFLTNETVFELTTLPPRLLVIGGGPLGCEIAQAFSRFGSKVVIVQDLPLFLPKEERDAAQMLSDSFARDGIEVRLNTEAVNVRVENGSKIVDLVSDDYKSSVEVDTIMTGTGRLPNVGGLDLAAAGIAYDGVAGIKVDDFLRTTNRRIFAAGDVCLEHKFTHTAEASARIVVQNALFLGRKRQSKLTIPWCTYTDPAIAHVGLYVREANARGIPVSTFTIPLSDVDRAVLDSERIGFVKIHVRDRSDCILGATIVARHAGDLINEITLAMVAGIGMKTLSKVIHAYPTQAAAIKHAADAWNRSRLTPGVQSLLQRWVRW